MKVVEDVKAKEATESTEEAATEAKKEEQKEEVQTAEPAAMEVKEKAASSFSFFQREGSQGFRLLLFASHIPETQHITKTGLFC